MSLTPPPSSHLSVVSFLCNALPLNEVNWVLTGSTALALRGIPVEPRDVDVQTDVAGALTAQEALAPYTVSPVRWKVTRRLKSHLGIFRVGSINVEVIGGLQIRGPDGSWSDPTDPRDYREIVYVNGQPVPMMTLEAEAEGYELLERRQRAELIRLSARGSTSPRPSG